MYPKELSLTIDSTQPLAEQLTAAFLHAAASELADALRMIEHCVGQLSDEQIWLRQDESLSSIGNLMLHLAGNLRQWVVVGLGGGVDQRNRPQEFAELGPLPRSELMSKLETCVHEAQQVLARLQPEELLAVRTIQGFAMTGIGALGHTIPHFRGHTQEIIFRTRLLLGPAYQFAWKPRTREEGATQ
jgi:hypothetical protein